MSCRYSLFGYKHLCLSGIITMLVGCALVWAGEQETEWFTQKPEIAPSEVRAARQPIASTDSEAQTNDSDDSSGLPATKRELFQVLPGFQVELLYTVPKETQGSWISMTFDDRGRVLASSEGDKGLYRIVPPPIGSDQETRVEKLQADVTTAHGLLYAFNSLYVTVNARDRSGLYRLRDTNGDDAFDEAILLKPIHGYGEHGPHAVRLSPDGTSLYLVCGNHTNLPNSFFHASRVPSNWDEGLLLPRQWDAGGHARGRMAPGGWICRTDPNGNRWDVISVGYRNVYDMDFNADGELCVYDADMEWDMGAPWYRPTRVNHATSGSEFGWRSGTGKWPTYYVDSLPQVVDIGSGSPVGVTFGYGARFPEKYQRALYLLDWTFGTIHAVHLTPQGASYVGEREEFLARAALPLTDAAVGPDGALYFTVGGRGTQSALYRVTHVGDDPVAPADARDDTMADYRQLRRMLEAYHRPAPQVSTAVDFVWPQLGHVDRHIRYAARTALEHQPVEHWAERALQDRNPQSRITALVALARQGDASLQPRLLDALRQLDFSALTEAQQLEALRVYALTFIRLGEPDRQTAQRVWSRLDAFYPAPSDALNAELSRLLVYLNSPTVIDKTLALLTTSSETSERETQQHDLQLLARNEGFGNPIAQMVANPPPQQAIHYAFLLRNLRYGWTLEQRQTYFHWLDEVRNHSGGRSYQGFIDNIREEALENVSDDERKLLESEVVDPAPINQAGLPMPTGPGRTWTVDDVIRLTEDGLAGRDFELGRRAYAAAKCVVCHRFAGQGGNTGPDLTNVAGRFSVRDLADAIIHSSRIVSDQYRAMLIHTESGKTIQGRIVNEDDEQLTVATDAYNGRQLEIIAKTDVEQMFPSKVSLMPDGLLNTLNDQEVLDLVAFLMSRGDANDLTFVRAKS